MFNTTFEYAPASAPRDLTVVGVDNHPSSVNLNWQPPRQPNGEITGMQNEEQPSFNKCFSIMVSRIIIFLPLMYLTGYAVYYTTDSTQRDRDWIAENVMGDKMTTTIKGLTPSTTYFFKIQARNIKGPGPFSSTVSLTTSSSKS